MQARARWVRPGWGTTIRTGMNKSESEADGSVDGMIGVQWGSEACLVVTFRLSILRLVEVQVRSANE